MKVSGSRASVRAHVCARRLHVSILYLPAFSLLYDDEGVCVCVCVASCGGCCSKACGPCSHRSLCFPSPRTGAHLGREICRACKNKETSMSACVCVFAFQ